MHEQIKRIIIVALVLSATAAGGLADGKMFWREKIPPDIPYQRAFILFKDGTETLVLQSKYEIPEADSKTTLGWVVPVPAAPEVASMPAYDARELFLELGIRTTPVITSISSILFGIVLPITAVLVFLVCWLPAGTPSSPAAAKIRKGIANISAAVLICWLFVILLTPTLGTLGAKSDGVDVIAEHRVGIYDVRVVRSDSADELISWLNTNEFKFGPEDTAAFDSYISKGWCFVVAIINPAGDQHGYDIASEGLAAPLILRFSSAQPVYPLALTGTGGYETEVLIYLASDTKMSCDDRMALRFAGNFWPGYFSHRRSETKLPEGFFELKPDERLWLCKFKGRLSPADMSRDMIFQPAKDQDFYQEHIVRW